MPIFQTNFSEYSINAIPYDWTARWSIDTWEVQDTGTGKMLRKPVTSAMYSILSWDKIDGKGATTITAKVRSSGSTAIRLGITARASGLAASSAGYTASLTNNNTLEIFKHTGSGSNTSLGSTALTVSIDVWYWIKLALNGSSIKVKAWQDGTVEPSVWGLERTDATYTVGWTGIASFSTGAVECSYFEVELPPVPTNLKPDIVEPEKETIFTWDNDLGYIQNAYEIEYKEKDSPTWISTGKSLSSSQEHVFIADTFTLIERYQWRARTWDSTDSVTEWSDIYEFSTPTFAYFLQNPKVTTRSPQATHIIVRVRGTSTEASATISPEPPVETSIKRLVVIDSGTVDVCQVIADELISRWGREQKSVQGTIPLNVQLNFKDKVRIRVPYAGIDEDMFLQRKEHSITGAETSITCGDISLGDSELIARIIDDLLK